MSPSCMPSEEVDSIVNELNFRCGILREAESIYAEKLDVRQQLLRTHVTSEVVLDKTKISIICQINSLTDWARTHVTSEVVLNKTKISIMCQSNSVTEWAAVTTLDSDNWSHVFLSYFWIPQDEHDSDAAR
ncbi:hypothetical protein J6590_089500 [Homalodisca vitripennis]|nr:hypothetical protein J6590_089500 [Homalodisca vitripennis]